MYKLIISIVNKIFQFSYLLPSYGAFRHHKQYLKKVQDNFQVLRCCSKHFWNILLEFFSLFYLLILLLHRSISILYLLNLYLTSKINHIMVFIIFTGSILSHSVIICIRYNRISIETQRRINK